MSSGRRMRYDEVRGDVTVSWSVLGRVRFCSVLDSTWSVDSHNAISAVLLLSHRRLERLRKLSI